MLFFLVSPFPYPAPLHCFDDPGLGLVSLITNVINRAYPVSTLLCLIYITFKMSIIRKVSLGVSVGVGLYSGVEMHVWQVGIEICFNLFFPQGLVQSCDI